MTRTAGMERPELERLIEGLVECALSRREFVGRALGLGMSLGSIGMVLSACRGREREAPTRGAGTEGSALGPIERELRIYNWSDYIADDLVPNFEEEFGVRVTYDTYESNEEMIARLQAGATGYDIIVPSGYVIPVLVAADLIDPVRGEYLTNRENVSPVFRNTPQDPDNTHSVPWQWGTTGIAYRNDRVGHIDSWGVFLDPRHADTMTMLDDGREVIGAFLRYRGRSLNSTDPAELASAKADAIAAKRNLKAYISGPVKSQLIAGDVLIAQLWNGDTTQAGTEQPNLTYVVPKEGSTIFVDSMCIPRGAPHKRVAHEWMNYILRPDVGAELSRATGFGTPNAAAAGLIENPVPYPTEAEMGRLEYQVDLGEHTETWDRIWTEIKSA